jgi:hypothetical protein
MFSKVFFAGSMVLALGFCAGVHADTAADCIGDYQAAKIEFRTASFESEIECTRVGNTVSLFATGANPAHCGGEGEWHLEAKAVGGNNAICSTRILGNRGEGCAMERVIRQLQGREAAEWRRYVEDQCDEG